MAKNCYLRVGRDYLEDAQQFTSIAAAKDAFHEITLELDRFGQETEASIHIANNKDELDEYPDYVLSLGPRGGLKVERA